MVAPKVVPENKDDKQKPEVSFHSVVSYFKLYMIHQQLNLGNRVIILVIT